MSSHAKPAPRISIPDIAARKGRQPLVVVSTYTAPLARAFDAHADILLVGDSLGMVLYGLPSTLQVSLEMMVAHGAATVRCSQRACVVVDMPFGSYQPSLAHAFESCARVLRETGCQAVKIEGGVEMAETVAFLTQRGIPVMGHVALMPQYVNALGGYRYRGRTPQERAAILADAKAIAAAGAFSIVLEGLEESLAREITEAVAVPTIGIGASPACDGQVLVAEDMLGLTDTPARFVKRYADFGAQAAKAAERFAAEVRERSFPAPGHCYIRKDE